MIRSWRERIGLFFGGILGWQGNVVTVTPGDPPDYDIILHTSGIGTATFFLSARTKTLRLNTAGIQSVRFND